MSVVKKLYILLTTYRPVHSDVKMSVFLSVCSAVEMSQDVSSNLTLSPFPKMKIKCSIISMKYDPIQL